MKLFLMLFVLVAGFVFLGSLSASMEGDPINPENLSEISCSKGDYHWIDDSPPLLSTGNLLQSLDGERVWCNRCCHYVIKIEDQQL